MKSLIPCVALVLLASAYCSEDEENVAGLESSAILEQYGNVTSDLHILSKFLSPVLQDSPNRHWVRCWRAQTDGWNVRTTFHPKCDYKGPTVTLVRVKNYILGGYSDKSWHNKYSNNYAYSDKAFLFSLYNTRGYYPLKFPVVRMKDKAIYRFPSLGPTFGGGPYDMSISNFANKPFINGAPNYVYGYQYKNPPGCSNWKYCRFYVGKGTFYASDVEVFYETTK